MLLTAFLLLTGCASTCVAAAQTPASIAAINTKDMDFTFSDRELAGSYEARKAVTITGSGSTAAIEGSGAALSGGAVRITKAGVYLLSGEFSGLPVHVAAGDNDKVQLVLDNASITCPDGPALLIESADKVLRLSVSKNTPTGGVCLFSLRTRVMQSTRLRAKRLTLFVTMRSYSPRSQAAIIRLKSSRFLRDVPEMPSSA